VIVRFDGLNARFIMHTCVAVDVQALPPTPPVYVYVGELLPHPSIADTALMSTMRMAIPDFFRASR
jgi:hypothetical protein